MVSWAGWLEAPKSGMLARVPDVTVSQVRGDSFLLRCSHPLLQRRPRGVGGEGAGPSYQQEAGIGLGLLRMAYDR